MLRAFYIKMKRGWIFSVVFVVCLVEYDLVGKFKFGWCRLVLNLGYEFFKFQIFGIGWLIRDRRDFILWFLFPSVTLF